MAVAQVDIAAILKRLRLEGHPKLELAPVAKPPGQRSGLNSKFYR